MCAPPGAPDPYLKLFVLRDVPPTTLWGTAHRSCLVVLLILSLTCLLSVSPYQIPRMVTSSCHSGSLTVAHETWPAIT